MSRPRTDKFWLVRVGELAEAAAEQGRRLGAGRIERDLTQIAAREGRDDAPSIRQVGRLLRAHRAKSDEERALYRRFRWPESMEAGLLPWEANRVGLDLLRRSYETARRQEDAEWTAPEELESEPEGVALADLARTVQRPTIRAVRWHWRIEQAGGGVDPELRHQIAWWWDRDAGRADIDEAFELLLALAPWRGREELAAWDEWRDEVRVGIPAEVDDALRRSVEKGRSR